MRHLILCSILIGCQAGKNKEPSLEEAAVPVAQPTNTVVKPVKEPLKAESPTAQNSEEQLACIEACVQGRQAEAVAADLIEQQCTDSCTGNPSLTAPQLESSASDTPVKQEAQE